MEYNTSSISDRLNDYAIDRIYEILERYGSILSDDYIETFDTLIATNRVITVHAMDEEVMKHFDGNSIPPASGPRSWEDGLVHIYPFIYKNTKNEQVKDIYINEGIITHELFHYLIRLDELNSNPEYNDYFSYLNEGLVQYLTEKLEGRKFTSSNYRRNVEFVKVLLNKLDNNLKGIINRRLDKEELDIINGMYQEYVMEQSFINDLNNYLIKVSNKTNIPHEKLVNYYKTKSIQEIKEDIYVHLLNLNDEELTKEFDNIVDSFESKNNKKAY